MVHTWVPSRQLPPILWKLSWIIIFWTANAPNLYFCGGLFWKGMPKEHRINKCLSSSLYLLSHIFLNLFIFIFYYNNNPNLSLQLYQMPSLNRSDYSDKQIWNLFVKVIFCKIYSKNCLKNEKSQGNMCCPSGPVLTSININEGPLCARNLFRC